jgi:NarL family two-component system response regulator LiaR
MAEQAPIQVLVVDDHQVIRSGLRFSLLAFDDIELVGEARSGEEALRLCEQVHPDVVLMDLLMPGLDGVAATRAIRERWPEVRVVALTSFQDGELVQSALQAGAIGYLLKDVLVDQLAWAIRSAYAGKTVLDPTAAQALANTVAQADARDYELTERQREVLALLVEGLTNSEIADRLVVSLSTVRFHVSTILSKLDASNRAEAAAIAVKHGLI